jgi:hypothetical protein
MRLLAAVAALALLAGANGALPGPTTTTWSGAVNALGVAGSPSARTLFVSYFSNWQFNFTSIAYPPISNNNFYVIRASRAAARRPCVPDAASRRDLQPHVQRCCA